MLIVYDPVYESKDSPPPARQEAQPKLRVDVANNFLLSLSTRDFQVTFKEGRGEVTLTRNMSPDEIKSFAKSLLKSVAEYENKQAEVISINNPRFIPPGVKFGGSNPDDMSG